MITIFEGQISFGGMHDALEQVSRQKNVKNGVLRITSQNASGTVGVFCGRFITGARINLTSEVGYDALRKLLAAKDGSFAFLDAGAEPADDLKQSLAVDLQVLLQSQDVAEVMALSSDSLTGLVGDARDETISYIDTDAELANEPLTEALTQPPPLPPPPEVSLAKLAEIQRARAVEITELKVEPAVEPAVESDVDEHGFSRIADNTGVHRRRQIDAPRAIVIPAGDEIPPAKPPHEPRPQSVEDYKRTRDWSQKGNVYRKVALSIVAVVTLCVLMYMAPGFIKSGPKVVKPKVQKSDHTAKPAKAGRTGRRK